MLGMHWQSSRNGTALESGRVGAANAKQDTLRVQWKIIMRHQFAAFISTSSICMMVLLMLLCLPDKVKSEKTSLDFWGLSKTSRITKGLMCENESLSFLKVATVHFERWFFES